ncbi:MAG: cytochrome c oxidase assembly protein [Trueperaceae bacterium]|nr:cytochrome c oxidase assembly protein [Trueperaceae bacterium]
METLELSGLWRFEPIPLAATFAALLLYTAGVGPLRQRFFPGRPFPARQASVFYLSLALLTLTFMSPLHTLGEYVLLSAHMATVVIVVFFVAPLFLLGLPGWLLRPLVDHPVVRPVLSFLVRPTVNVIHFNLAFLVIHIPVALKFMMFSPGTWGEFLHYYTYFAIFGSSVLMWWTVINPVPDIIRTPAFRGQLIYLLVMTLAHNPFSSVVTFAPDILYPWYRDTTGLMGLTPIQDQHTAGLIMGVVYITVMLAAMTTVLMRWFADNDPNRAERDTPTLTPST